MGGWGKWWNCLLWESLKQTWEVQLHGAGQPCKALVDVSVGKAGQEGRLGSMKESCLAVGITVMLKKMTSQGERLQLSSLSPLGLQASLKLPLLSSIDPAGLHAQLDTQLTPQPWMKFWFPSGYKGPFDQQEIWASLAPLWSPDWTQKTPISGLHRPQQVLLASALCWSGTLAVGSQEPSGRSFLHPSSGGVLRNPNGLSQSGNALAPFSPARYSGSIAGLGVSSSEESEAALRWPTLTAFREGWRPRRSFQALIWPLPAPPRPWAPGTGSSKWTPLRGKKVNAGWWGLLWGNRPSVARCHFLITAGLLPFSYHRGLAAIFSSLQARCHFLITAGSERCLLEHPGRDAWLGGWLGAQVVCWCFEASIGIPSQVALQEAFFDSSLKILESSQYQPKPQKQICEESEQVTKPEAVQGTLAQLRGEGKQEIYLALVGWAADELWHCRLFQVWRSCCNSGFLKDPLEVSFGFVFKR